MNDKDTVVEFSNAASNQLIVSSDVAQNHNFYSPQIESLLLLGICKVSRRGAEVGGGGGGSGENVDDREG